MEDPMSSEGQRPHIKENPHKGNPLSFLKGALGKPRELTPAYGTATPASHDRSDNGNADTNPNVLAITQTPRAPKTPSRDKSRNAPVPTQEEAEAANAGKYAPRGFTKIMLDAARNHPVRTIGAALAVTAGTIAVVEAVRGNIPGIHRSVDQSVSSSENPAPVQKLKVIPPGRENIQENLPPANAEGNLPEIKPYIQQVRLPGREEIQQIPFPSGFNFRLEGKPPSTKTIKEFSPQHPEGINVETEVHPIPGISIQAYVLAKEQSSDGSIFIALGIPKDDNKLFSKEDIDKPGVTQLDFYDGKIGGVSTNIIVWAHIPAFADYQYPLQSFLGWMSPDRSRGSQTSDPKQMFGYINVGDPAHAGGYRLPFPDDDRLDELQKNYQQKNGKVPYETAKGQYLALGSQNVATLQKIIEDAKAGNVSLREQLETKRYIIETQSLSVVINN